MTGRNLPLWMKALEDSAHHRAEMERVGQLGAGRPGFGGMTALPVPQSGPLPGEAPLPASQLDALLAAIWRRTDVFMLPFTVGLVPVLLRPAEKRSYVFLQNQSGAATLALGINQPPGPLTSVPVAGLVIAANFGFYEPLAVPQGELWIVASAGATPGILLYSA